MVSALVLIAVATSIMAVCASVLTGVVMFRRG